MAVLPSAGSKQVASVHADIGANTSGFEKGAASVAGGLGKLALSVGTVTTAIELMVGAFNFAKEGSQLQRLADAGAEIARQYGGNMDLIIEKVKAASMNTVSEMDIIRSANKAMMLGLGADADQLANLMEIAAFRGRAMGVSTTQAFDDIVRGVGRASPLILDNLGIVVKLGEVNEEYAKSVGKTVQELSAAEKKQALLNSVLKTGNKLLDEAGGLVEDNATQYERLTARQQDYIDGVKQSFNEAITPSIEAFLDLSEAMDKVEESTGRTDQRSRLYLGAMQQQIDKENELKDRVNDTTTARMNGIASLYQTAAAGQEVIETTDEMSKANEDFLSLIERMQGQTEDFAERYKSINEDMNLTDEERRAKIAEVAADEEMANRRVILSMLEKQLSLDGLSAQETEYLLSKGLEWGIYSQGVVDEAKRAQAEVAALVNQINGIPAGKTFTLSINSIYSQASAASSYGAATVGGRRAGGGSVEGGRSYLVGEQGMEMFTPTQDGTITPNHKMGSGKGNVTIQILLDSGTPDPERVAYNLQPAIERAVRNMQQAGRL